MKLKMALLLVLILCLVGLVFGTFRDFQMLTPLHEPTCVDIPKNMSLCVDIGYEKMRLPNLLNHETLPEIQQQSVSWIPLINVQCHPHTKVFLCSLFTPVCLENEIYPCRSLCLEVQNSCESRMKVYGYHWPDMLKCEKFPLDNDMCIKVPEKMEKKKQRKKNRNNRRRNRNKSNRRKEKSNYNPEEKNVSLNKDKSCVCDSGRSENYENIIQNFCSSDTVFKSKIKRVEGFEIFLRKPKMIKTTAIVVYENDLGDSGRQIMKLKNERKRNTKRQKRKKKRKHGGGRIRKIRLDKESSCCNLQKSKKIYLIMATRLEDEVKPSLILPWDDSKALRKAMRLIRNIDCSDRKFFTNNDNQSKTVHFDNGKNPMIEDEKKTKKIYEKVREIDRNLATSDTNDNFFNIYDNKQNFATNNEKESFSSIQVDKAQNFFSNHEHQKSDAAFHKENFSINSKRESDQKYKKNAGVQNEKNISNNDFIDPKDKPNLLHFDKDFEFPSNRKVEKEKSDKKFEDNTFYDSTNTSLYNSADKKVDSKVDYFENRWPIERKIEIADNKNLAETMPKNENLTILTEEANYNSVKEKQQSELKSVEMGHKIHDDKARKVTIDDILATNKKRSKMDFEIEKNQKMNGNESKKFKRNKKRKNGRRGKNKEKKRRRNKRKNRRRKIDDLKATWNKKMST